MESPLPSLPSLPSLCYCTAAILTILLIPSSKLHCSYASSLPPSLSGKKTVKEAARDFMCTWENGAGDGVISYQEFEDYYKGNRQTDTLCYGVLCCSVSNMPKSAFPCLLTLKLHTNNLRNALHSLQFRLLYPFSRTPSLPLGVSSSIDNEDYFELMIRNAWRMAGGEVQMKTALHSTTHYITPSRPDLSHTIVLL
jgi:hypothetical protein